MDFNSGYYYYELVASSTPFYAYDSYESTSRVVLLLVRARTSSTLEYYAYYSYLVLYAYSLVVRILQEYLSTLSHSLLPHSLST